MVKFNEWLNEKRLWFTETLGGELVDEETRKKRLSVCYGSMANVKNRDSGKVENTCPKLSQKEDKRLDECLACSCPVQLKASYKTHLFSFVGNILKKNKNKKIVECPLKKWAFLNEIK